MGLGRGPLLSFAFFLGGLPLLCPSDEVDVTEKPEVDVMKNVDVKKLAGKWYPIVSAKSEAMPRPFHAFTLETQKNGSGTVLKLEIPASCKIRKYPLETVSPGVFTTEDNSTIKVLDTDYDSYLISEYLSEATVFLCLYATQMEVKDKVLKKFKTFVEKMNMDPERLFYRHGIDLCSLKKRKKESK